MTRAINKAITTAALANKALANKPILAPAVEMIIKARLEVNTAVKTLRTVPRAAKLAEDWAVVMALTFPDNKVPA